jgi:hypothetical protein
MVDVQGCAPQFAAWFTANYWSGRVDLEQLEEMQGGGITIPGPIMAPTVTILLYDILIFLRFRSANLMLVRITWTCCLQFLNYRSHFKNGQIDPLVLFICFGDRLLWSTTQYFYITQINWHEQPSCHSWVAYTLILSKEQQIFLSPIGIFIMF